MQISIYDDGKGKSQSVEASISGCNIPRYLPGDSVDIVSGLDISNLVGFGSTEEEATTHLLNQLDFVTDMICEYRDKVCPKPPPPTPHKLINGEFPSLIRIAYREQLPYHNPPDTYNILDKDNYIRLRDNDSVRIVIDRVDFEQGITYVTAEYRIR